MQKRTTENASVCFQKKVLADARKAAFEDFRGNFSALVETAVAQMLQRRAAKRKAAQ